MIVMMMVMRVLTDMKMWSLVMPFWLADSRTHVRVGKAHRLAHKEQGNQNQRSDAMHHPAKFMQMKTKTLA